MGDKKMNPNVATVCLIGAGNKCCRYLMVGGYGFECAKITALKTTLDTRVKQGRMIAQGDNCEGKGMSELN
jgi:hypothetical protein